MIVDELPTKEKLNTGGLYLHHCVRIVREIDGKNIVFIHDIRFKGRQNIEWKEVEVFLKE